MLAVAAIASFLFITNICFSFLTYIFIWLDLPEIDQDITCFEFAICCLLNRLISLDFFNQYSLYEKYFEA